MFSQKGIVTVKSNGHTEEKVLEDCIEFAEDVQLDDDEAIIEMPVNLLRTGRDTLSELGYEILTAETEWIPSTYTELTDEDDLKKMNTLLSMLEDNDDVQNVWHNFAAMP